MPWPTPLLPGFHPDPSVVRVDDDYYLATSSFEYLPGIPIHHSRDLVSWQLIGHVATRPGQLQMDGVPTAGGAWAPTIRWRDGTFYVVVTDALGRGTLLFTASDPAGPWSDGVPVDGVEGIDPDVAWDGDDCYLTYSGLVLSGDRHRASPRHPAGAGRPRERTSPRAAAVALVGQRTDVPGGATPVPHRGLVVPDDRRGRHRARSRHQHRPFDVAGRAVRTVPGQPGAQRAQHRPADPEHGPRRPDPGARTGRGSPCSSECARGG